MISIDFFIKVLGINPNNYQVTELLERAEKLDSKEEKERDILTVGIRLYKQAREYINQAKLKK